jgi:hypothetical protein
MVVEVINFVIGDDGIGGRGGGVEFSEGCSNAIWV